MSEIDDILSGFGAQTVLCVGDLMLDEYVYGQVSRISPEAATPVLAIARRELQIGGAGNAARNIAGLGANCIFVGVVGHDDAGRVLASEFRATPRLEAHLATDQSRPTTRKVRFVSEQHSTHLLRADWETTAALAPAIEAAAIENILAALPRAGALLLSDYAKGMLTPRLIQTAIAAARQASVPVIVDPKGSDYSVYRGATVITPNRKELGEATRLPVATTSEIEAAASALAREIACDAVVVTRSEEGMSLYRRSGEATHIAAYPVRVRDVSGAGDTGAAVLATCLAMRADLAAALRVSNAAAAVVVGKRGTATVEPGELRARLETPATRPAEPKVASDRAGALAQVEAWRRQGLRVGFTNGCFDLLHPGHVKLLTAARAACDRLVVGLNSDASVAALKGPGRPIQGENARAAVLAALEAVDLVVIFAEQTPLELVRSLRPDLLVKGADYQLHEVVGRDIVEAGGGEVLLIELLPGFSTSALAAGREKR